MSVPMETNKIPDKAITTNKYPKKIGFLKRSFCWINCRYRPLNLSKRESFVAACFTGCFFIIQLARTGIKVCEAKKEAIIADPTAMDNGMNISLGIPTIIKEGIKTARIHNKIRNFGIEISNKASKIARCLVFFISKCWWIFSMVTVASSTRIPIANARPLRVIILMVWPNRYNIIIAVSTAIGIVSTTIRAPRLSPRNRSTIRPVSTAPKIPSCNKLERAFSI